MGKMTLPVRVPHDNKGDCEAVDSGQDYDATKVSKGVPQKPKKGKGRKK